MSKIYILILMSFIFVSCVEPVEVEDSAELNASIQEEAKGGVTRAPSCEQTAPEITISASSIEINADETKNFSLSLRNNNRKKCGDELYFLKISNLPHFLSTNLPDEIKIKASSSVVLNLELRSSSDAISGDYVIEIHMIAAANNDYMDFAQLAISVPAVQTEPQPTAPVLDSAVRSGSDYILNFSQPAGSLIPAGGYDTFINGADQNEHDSSYTRTLSGLDVSAQQCFKMEARYTQLSPTLFLASNEICVAPESVDPDPVAPVLDSAVLAGSDYILTGHMPAGSETPAGGYKSIIDGVTQSDINPVLNRTISGLNTSVQHCFRLQARWTQLEPTVFRTSNEICVSPTTTDPGDTDLAWGLNPANIFFRSGYENGVNLVVQDQDSTDLSGADSSGYDWVSDLESLPFIDSYFHNHVSGVYGVNFDVALVDDGGDRVLKMTNHNPTGSPLSRAQATLKGSTSSDKLTEGSFHHRMKFGEGFDNLGSMSDGIPSINGKNYWFDIYEFWESRHGADHSICVNGAGCGRLSVYLKKVPGVGGKVYWFVRQEKVTASGRVALWSYTNDTVPVPIGEWFTIKSHFKYGDENTGHFKLSIVHNGAEHVIFNVHNRTKNPHVNQGFAGDWQPIKIYSSSDIYDALGPQTGYYDDMIMSRGPLTPEYMEWLNNAQVNQY